MICIYRENHEGADLPDCPRISFVTSWPEFTSNNLYYALLYIKDATLLQATAVRFMLELDGHMFDPDLLLRNSRSLKERFSRWLFDLERTRLRAARPRPVFGL